MTASTPPDVTLPDELRKLLQNARSVRYVGSVDEMVELAVPEPDERGYHHVSYDVPGQGNVEEAVAFRVRNGIAANYTEPYMRRRDPDCMFIADDKPTNKPHFRDRFKREFGPVRNETFAWLATQDLACFFFRSGVDEKGLPSVAVCPANAGFFALGLALLQGILPLEEVHNGFEPRAFIYVAPPFRHTHFGGRQVVVHNRGEGIHELFSYNLYPGPSAKKGVYGMLLYIGVRERWVTMHCATVQVITPYENRVVITHEGASGGGKSEMLEYAHRQPDGTLLIGRNLETGETRTFTLPKGCDLRPVTDDMALCHPSLEKGNGKLSLMDAEEAWFVRCNHIDRYGTDPNIEALTVHPPMPLLFLNIHGRPGATTLLWEHIEDAPGEPCPNPRVVIPRKIIPNVVHGAVDVDVRSMGVRSPPCTAARPTYGIIGLFHLLPPALAWLWRLVVPRGHANPSIVETAGMTSEGVGSYWPFATGRMVDHANLLLNQIVDTPEVRYVLIPNQHIGAWEVGFMPQWITREYLARRGGARFAANRLRPSRCALLGYTPRTIMVEGSTLGNWFFEVENQPEVGPAAYDEGAKILTEFFHRELKAFLGPDLLASGQRIIECCLDGGRVEDYLGLLELPCLDPDDN